MPAPFPTGAAANSVPAIYSKKLNAKFLASTSLYEMCNTDWEGDIKGQGSEVHIRSAPDVNVFDYTGSLTYANLQSGKVVLPIDKAKAYTFLEDLIQNKQSDINEINAATQDAASRMKIAIETDVHALMASEAGVQWGTPVTGDVVTKNTIVDMIVDLGVLLDDNNVPEEGRFLKLPPWACGLIKKSELKDASITGDGQSILRTGRLGMIDTFTIYKSNTLPTASGITSILAGTKHATAFANQIVEHRRLPLTGTFGFGHSGLNVYGRKVVYPNALVLAGIKKS